jgi:hypothetical protein
MKEQYFILHISGNFQTIFTFCISKNNKGEGYAKINWSTYNCYWIY